MPATGRGAPADGAGNGGVEAIFSVASSARRSLFVVSVCVNRIGANCSPLQLRRRQGDPPEDQILHQGALGGTPPELSSPDPVAIAVNSESIAKGQAVDIGAAPK